MLELLDRDLLVALGLLRQLLVKLRVLSVELRGLLLQVLELVLLKQSLVLQPLVLGLDVALNLRDVLLSIALSLRVKVLLVFLERFLYFSFQILHLLLAGPLQLV